MNARQTEGVIVRVLPDGRLSRQDAAKFLGFSEKTLAQWASQGKGPPIIKVAGRAFYRLTDLEKLAAGNPVAA